MSSKLDSPETVCIKQANVFPQWLPCNNVFWYKLEPGPGIFQFILVDCVKGTRRVAFDHTSLAAQLSKCSSKEISPGCLPFWWINVATDGSWVRFQFDGHTWQYGADDNLEVIGDDNFSMGKLDCGCHEAPSPWSRRKGHVRFVNHTPHPITYSWIDNDGTPQQLGSLQSGQAATQSSYVGHIWRLADRDSGKSIACSVTAQQSVATIVSSPDSLMISWGSEPLTMQSDVDQDTSSEKRTEPYIRDFNVWAKQLDGSETPLSYDGVENNQFKDLYVSPNRLHAVVWQCQPQFKRIVHTVESAPLDQLCPKLLNDRISLNPGDNVEIQRPRLFNLEMFREIPVQDALFWNPFKLTDLGWSRNGKKYRFIFNERGHRCLRLLEIDLEGTVTVLVEEQSKTFIDYAHKLYHKIMDTTDELLWASERSGWNHLYLYDLRGNLKHQVTQGKWMIRSVERVDETKRQIWFEGMGMVPGQDPYYSHLACIDFSGANLRIITQGDGTHSWQWGPDKQFLIDTWSRIDYPPQAVLRAAETGEEIVALEHGNLELLLQAGWSPPERFEAPGRDGRTKIYGIIIRPRGFDPSVRYPILERIYAGPQGFYTPKRFGNLPKLRRYADKGYVVVCLDGMGTNWRSKAFHDLCYKNLKDSGFPDRILWIRAASETRPWMDISRVGCYGSSAGGQNAAAAVIHHHDFYRAASALAGCHDNRLDKLWWNELWMGYPVDDSYRDSSNITHASKLGGALMLAVGELDTSINPSTTLRLARTLIEAGKDFDLVYVPGGGHQLADMPYVMQKQDSFFQTHLQAR